MGLLYHAPQVLSKLILRTGPVAFLMAARDAAVHDLKLSFDHLCLNRLHKSAAGSGPIARVNVDVAAPQASRTVVGIAIAFDVSPAVPTREIFDVTFENFRHRCAGYGNRTRVSTLGRSHSATKLIPHC